MKCGLKLFKIVVGFSFNEKEKFASKKTKLAELFQML